LQRHEEARKSYTNSIRLKSDYARARAAYDEALKIEPDNQNLIGMKENAIAALGETEEGLKLK